MGSSIQHCLILVILVAFAGHAHAFGAGNIASISRIEGQNWRHGDIEDALLTIAMARVAGGRKFSKLDVQRVYFGNWLRDYSQAVDVGTLKYVSAEAIRVLIWVLGFLSFGYVVLFQFLLPSFKVHARLFAALDVAHQSTSQDSDLSLGMVPRSSR